MNTPAQRRLARGIVETLTQASRNTGPVPSLSEAGGAGGDTRDTPPALYAYKPAWQGTSASHVAAREYLSRRAVVEGRRQTRITHVITISATLILAGLLIYFDPPGIVHAPACPTGGC